MTNKFQTTSIISELLQRLSDMFPPPGLLVLERRLQGRQAGLSETDMRSSVLDLVKRMAYDTDTAVDHAEQVASCFADLYPNCANAIADSKEFLASCQGEKSELPDNLIDGYLNLVRLHLLSQAVITSMLDHAIE